jgi:cell division protein FtsQ
VAPPRLLVRHRRSGSAPDAATRPAIIAGQRRALSRTRRRQRWLRAAGRVVRIGAGLAAGVLVAILGVRWLETTPWLAVTQVEIQGLRRVPEATVRAAARIEPGVNLVGLDAGAIEARVRELPGVRGVRLVRHLPGRATLMVEEREPYVLVNAAATRFATLYWVDADGHPVGPERAPAATPTLPILSGVSRRPEDGDRVPPDVQAGLSLLRAVQRVGGRVAGRISEIDVTAADDPVLHLADGAAVRVGTEAWDERLTRLDGVLGELDTRGERVTSVDLRFRDLVVLRPRPGPAEPPGPAAAPVRRRPGPGLTPNPMGAERR